MAGNGQHRRTNSVAPSSSYTFRRPRRPAGRSDNRPPTSSTPLILPSISSLELQRAPTELREAHRSIFYDNKVILCFEAEFTTAGAGEWVEFFNQKNDIQLTLADSLPLALFVVQFNTDNLPATKTALLAASPLGARDVYASVNDHYTDRLIRCDLPSFKHLVTIQIF